ncbi:MAG: electron transfer flavoprotein subunit alpha/FixB family protein [Chloroflexi bacterium]|nr:electron transfer flavoprotein subunit alpha/FixB family protein [Chloroflexota bacterium]
MIFVWAEHFEGKLVQASREALGLATQLDGDVTALIFGQGVDDVVQEAFHYGASKVIKADDATLADFRPEPYIALLAKLASDQPPDFVVAAATTRGREVLGGTSADLDTGLLHDVTEVQVEDGKLVATRPVYSGKVLATAAVAGDKPQFVTLRNRAFKPNEPDTSRSGEVSSVDPVLAENDITTKIESIEASTGEINLTDAAIIVSGGRGVGGPEGFEPIRNLATVLGGAVGASRATVDAGWIPYAHQVGQTGKVVSPDLYIAAGISGAIQHQAGMRTSKLIVAINKDPEAPIFKLARYGVVGDLFEVVPALTEEFKKRLGT